MSPHHHNCRCPELPDCLQLPGFCSRCCDSASQGQAWPCWQLCMHFPRGFPVQGKVLSLRVLLIKPSSPRNINVCSFCEGPRKPLCHTLPMPGRKLNAGLGSLIQAILPLCLRQPNQHDSRHSPPNRSICFALLLSARIYRGLWACR